jgi:hypothetical protein
MYLFYHIDSYIYTKSFFFTIKNVFAMYGYLQMLKIILSNLNSKRGTKMKIDVHDDINIFNFSKTSVIYIIKSFWNNKEKKPGINSSSSGRNI